MAVPDPKAVVRGNLTKGPLCRELGHISLAKFENNRRDTAEHATDFEPPICGTVGVANLC